MAAASIVVPVVLAPIIVAVLAVSSVVVCILYKKYKQQQIESVCAFDMLCYVCVALPLLTVLQPQK